MYIQLAGHITNGKWRVAMSGTHLFHRAMPDRARYTMVLRVDPDTGVLLECHECEVCDTGLVDPISGECANGCIDRSPDPDIGMARGK